MNSIGLGEWMPISEIHEDFNRCIVMDVHDEDVPMEIVTVLDIGFDVEKWTHFVPVPKVMTTDVVRWREAAGVSDIKVGDKVTCASWQGLTSTVSRIEVMEGHNLPDMSAESHEIAFFAEGGFWRTSQLTRVATP